MCYIKNELLFNHLNLDRANISRLIYLSTYIDYNDRQENLLVKHREGKKTIPMNKSEIKKVLKLSDSVFNKFLVQMKEKKLMYEVENKFYISNDYVTKGNLKSYFTKDNKSYTRIYINTTRFLYENCNARQHKQLSYAFQLIPKLHYETNVICENPDEKDVEKLIKLSLKDICKLLEVSTDKSDVLRFENNLYKLSINIDGIKYYLFKRVIIKGYNGKRDYFVVNPNVIWKGRDMDNSKNTINFMVFT